MSVRITESDSKTTGQGWQVSRRAFLAQTSALLVAMGIPAKRAAAIAGQMYQTKEQALAGSGYVDEILMAMSSRVTDGVDPSGAASVQLLVKKFYEDAGLANFDAHVEMDEYTTGAEGAQTVGALMGETAETATAAEVLARVVTPHVLNSIDSGLASASAKFGDGSVLGSSLAKVFEGALTTASLTDGAKPADPLYVYLDPERALLDRMVAPLHETRTRIESPVIASRISVGLTEPAGKLHSEVMNAVVTNWLDAQYADAEFVEARGLAQAILAKSDITLPKATEMAKDSLAYSGSSKDIVEAGLTKVRDLISDPSALHGALEQELAESQSELDQVLAKLDALSKDPATQSLQFAENVPGTRYVLADANGLSDKVAQEHVDELNRLNDSAGELSKKVIDLQFQMEDLNVRASDGRAVEQKLLALEHRLVQASESLEKAAAALQKSDAVSGSVSASAMKDKMAAAVEEAYGIVERNKSLAKSDVNPIDWAVQKAITANLLVQSAQMASVLQEGLQLKGGESVMAETFKLFGLWNQNVPVEGLEALCKEQLALRTDKALKATTAFADSVKTRFSRDLAGLDRAGWSKYINNVLASAFAQVDARLDTPVSSLGLDAKSTVAQMADALKSEIPAVVELKSLQENIFVAGMASVFADAVLATAKEDASLEAIAAMTPTQIAGGNVHVLAFQVLGGYAHQPVEGAIGNYLKTMVSSAFGADTPVSLAAYADIDQAKVEALLAKAQATQTVVASVKEPLSSAGFGLVGLLLPNLLGGLSDYSREVVVRQSKSALKINVD